MKRNFKKTIALLLAATSAFSLVACVGTEGNEPPAPDYSGYTNRFVNYAYTPPNNGVWNDLDGVSHSAGEDFRTVEQYKWYKECGFDILLAQSSGSYTGQDFETSDTKMVMDNAFEAGIDKVILQDTRIQALSDGKVNVDENGKGSALRYVETINLPDGVAAGKYEDASLIGEDKPFATEAELDAYVLECMSPYMEYKNFYGVQLRDEPWKTSLIPYGETYRAIERVCPDAYVQWNLFQAHTDEDEYPDTLEENKQYSKYYPEVEGTFASAEEKAFAMYEKYLESFIDSTGSTYLTMDSYPLKASKARHSYIRNLQICAETSKKKNVDFTLVMQTHATQDKAGKYGNRRQTEEDLRWLNNMALGFGVKQIVPYTYFAKGKDASMMCDNEASFITRYGERTELYYWMKDILAENQAWANVILNFDFVSSQVYQNAPTYYTTAHLTMAKNGDAFQKVTSVTIDKECALATELYDEENERYMYMVQNVVDPRYSGAKAYQEATVTFEAGLYTHALVYKNGEPTKVKLQNNTLSFKQNPGEASFILPY